MQKPLSYVKIKLVVSSIKGGIIVNIGFIAQGNRRVLLENFCIAYKGILKKHNLIATDITAQQIEGVTGLTIQHLLADEMGGIKQMTSIVERDNLDMLFLFQVQGNGDISAKEQSDYEELSRMCDLYTIPLATNIATAESLILCLDHGDLEWRN